MDGELATDVSNRGPSDISLPEFAHISVAGATFTGVPGKLVEVTLAPVFVLGLSTIEFCSHSVQILACYQMGKE